MSRDICLRCRGTSQKWRGWESNPRHHDFQSCALPTELPRLGVQSRSLRAKASDRGGHGVDCIRPMKSLRATIGLTILLAVGAALASGGSPADSVRPRYLPQRNVLRTVARFGTVRTVTVRTLGDPDAVRPDPRWLAAARPLGPGAPVWARRMYAQSLFVLHAFTDRRTGAVIAGARDGWSYVWPRDASAAAMALAAAGYRGDARRIVRFLRRLDLGAAARFHRNGTPVDGRSAQGDAAGWIAAAEPRGWGGERDAETAVARAGRLPGERRRRFPRQRDRLRRAAPLERSSRCPRDRCPVAPAIPARGSTQPLPGRCAPSRTRRSTRSCGKRCCGSPRAADASGSSPPKTGAAGTIHGPRRPRGRRGASPHLARGAPRAASWPSCDGRQRRPGCCPSGSMREPAPPPQRRPWPGRTPLRSWRCANSGLELHQLPTPAGRKVDAVGTGSSAGAAPAAEPVALV